MILILLLQLLLAGSCCGLSRENSNVHLVNYLHVNHTHVQEALTLMQSIYTRNCVQFYCRNEESLKLGNIFQSNHIQLITTKPKAKYAQYKAMTAPAIYRAHLQGEECQEGKLVYGKKPHIHYITLSSHSQSCYGIFTDQGYSLTLLQQECDIERATRFALGIVLWLFASQVEKFLMLGYFMATVLGLHLASFTITCVAFFCVGGLKLQSLHPLGENFKLLLERYPTIVALSLVTGVWLMIRIYGKYRTLRHYKLVSELHFRIMKSFSYYLMLNASDHPHFGWCCVCLLWPWPELYFLIQWLKVQSVKIKRSCFPPNPTSLVSEETFEAISNLETLHALSKLSDRLRKIAKPMWEEVSKLRCAQNFARFVCSGNVEETSDEEETVTEDANVSLLEHLTAVINNHSSCGNDSAESLLMNLSCGDSTQPAIESTSKLNAFDN